MLISKEKIIKKDFTSLFCQNLELDNNTCKNELSQLSLAGFLLSWFRWYFMLCYHPLIILDHLEPISSLIPVISGVIHSQTSCHNRQLDWTWWCHHHPHFTNGHRMEMIETICWKMAKCIHETDKRHNLIECYNNVNPTLDTHNRHTTTCAWGELCNTLCEFEVWSVFYLSL